MNTDSKKIIIVDPFSTGTYYAPALIAAGYQCYSVLSNDCLGDYYLHSYQKSDFKNDRLLSVEEAKKRFCPEEICAVIAGSEPGVIQAELLGKYFSVNSNDSATSALRRDKFLMQEALKSKGIKYIFSKKISQYNRSIDNLPDACSFVLKPINSASSENVTVHNNKDSLEKEISKISWVRRNITGEIDTEYLIQEFIYGDEYVVDLVVTQQTGQFHVASVCQYKKGQYNNFDFVYEKLDILDPKDPALAELIDYAIECAKALEFRCGPIHMELIMTKNGPLMIEAAARLHGGIAPLLFAQCYQPDLITMALNTYLGKHNNLSSVLVSSGAIIFGINTKVGASVRNVEVLKNRLTMLPSFYHMRLLRSENIPLTTDLTTCPLIVGLIGDLAVINKDTMEVRKIFMESLMDIY